MKIMRSVFIPAAFLMIAASSVLAGEDLMAGYYGNTLIIWRDSDQTPVENHFWINEDHTFTAVDVSRKDGHMFVRMSKGNWEMQGKRFCRINNEVTPPTNSCKTTTLDFGEAGHRAGDKWDGVTARGVPEHFEVVAGRQ